MKRLACSQKRQGRRSSDERQGRRSRRWSNWVSRAAALKAAVVLGVVGAALAIILLAGPALAATFSDVFSNTYDNPDYPEAVGALSDLGVIGGFADGAFRPHDAVTRQQFAKMMVKILGLPVTGNEVCPFLDVAKGTDSKDPFYPDKYVAVCAAYGIAQGKTATMFSPYSSITRAQMLSMVVRAARQAGVVLKDPSSAYYSGTIPNSTFRDLQDATHGLNVQTAEMNNLFWGIWPDEGSSWNVYRNATRGEVALILWRLWQKMGSSSETSTTVPGVASTDWQTVSAGRWFTVALKKDGSLWTWGWNNYNQLGDGTTTDRSKPVKVGTDTDWLAISAGGWHSLALKKNGQLWGWGLNGNGRLGDGTTANRPGPIRIGSSADWVSISAGGWYSMAIKQNASMWGWGSNYYAQLGDGTTDDRRTPTKVGAATDDWATVATGGFHTLAIKKDGSLWAWGSNTAGQIGNGSQAYAYNPTRIGSDTDWVAISAGFLHSVAIKSDGSLWAWGNNANGELGDGTTTDRLVPTRIGSATDWLMVSTGLNHSLALKKDGSLWAWGLNDTGQLGDGTTTSRLVPTRIGSASDWQLVSAGGEHSVGLKKNGSLWAWGDNEHGEIGDGGTADRLSPVPVNAP